MSYCFFFQAEDGIRDLVRSRGLGDVYKRQVDEYVNSKALSDPIRLLDCVPIVNGGLAYVVTRALSLIHI